MKKLTAALIGIGILLAGTWNAQAAPITLTTAGATAVDGGVRYTQTAPQPTGTGVIDSFVRFQAGGNGTIEQGYNTTVNGTYDNFGDNPHNHEITVGGVGFTNTPSGPVMRFLLDINEPNGGNGSILKLDEIQVYVSRDANQSLEPALGLAQTIPFTNSALVYQLDAGAATNSSLDDTIVLDASLNHGSGSGDMYMDIPIELFNAAFAANASIFPTAGSRNAAYIYLYTKASYAAGGFEEWAFVNGTPIRQVPEPATALLMGVGLLGLVGLRKRNKYSA
jgi:hypothetical protein